MTRTKSWSAMLEPVVGRCGSDLSEAPVRGVQRRPGRRRPPTAAPLGDRGTRSSRRILSVLRRGRYRCRTARRPPGPSTGRGVARAAELLGRGTICPWPAPRLMASMLGVQVLDRVHGRGPGRAARLLEGAFLPRVASCCARSGCCTPMRPPSAPTARLAYVHVASTEFLTAMHTGGRTTDDIDAGKILPGYTGTIVRDGYAGYAHLSTPTTPGATPTCSATCPRSTGPTPRASSGPRRWPTPSPTPTTAPSRPRRRPRHPRPRAQHDPPPLPRRRRGRSATTRRAGPLARDARTLARRFPDHEDMILRFVVDLAVPFTNNQAERDLRPVKIQQRTSGGCWRTLAGLVDFAVVRSYLRPPTNGDSTHSTSFTSSSPPAPGYHPRPHPLNSYAPSTSLTEVFRSIS